MKQYRAKKDFTDWDGVKIKKGQVLGCVRHGGKIRKNNGMPGGLAMYFALDGKVTAVVTRSISYFAVPA